MSSIRSLSLLLCFAAIGLPATPVTRKPNVGTVTTWYTQIVPLVIVGEGWNQRILITNVDSKDAAVGTIRFFNKDGAPWTVNLKDRGRAASFLLNLSTGQSAIFETVVEQTPQVLGWALIELNSGALGDIFGQVVFRKQTPGLPDFMTSHILASQAYRKLVVPFDNTDLKYTGMAILTSSICTFSCDQAQKLRVTVRDLGGAVISQKDITQKMGVLYWMNLGADFPETVNRVGTFVVEPVDIYTTTLSGFSLQFAPNGAFTAITSFED